MPRAHSRYRHQGDEHQHLDALLIRALQADGRASLNHLAETFQVSRELVAQRVKHLVTNENLRIVAALDPGFAGHHVLVHGLVDVTGPAHPVAEALSQLPDTVIVSIVSGESPLIFESRHGSIEELHAVLETIREIPAVTRVRVTTYADVLQGFFVSSKRTDITLDAIDYQLIAELQHDGRMSYRALASRVHLSPSATRARVRRLIESGVIRISAIMPGGFSRTRLAMGIGITASGATRDIHRYLRASPALSFATKAHGAFDYIATIVGSSSQSLVTVLEEIRALPHVQNISSWTHIDFVKEDYARALGRVYPVEAVDPHR